MLIIRFRRLMWSVIILISISTTTLATADTIKSVEANAVTIKNGINSIEIPKSIFEPAEEIFLTFTASPNYPDKSWIGMFNADLPHDGMAANNNLELAYHYLKKSPKGTFTYTAPTKEGAYDFRMFDKGSGKEVATLKFSVVVDTAAASLKLPKKVFKPDEDIFLSYTASPHYPDQSWIGMFDADLPHKGMANNNNKELAYHYLKKSPEGTFTYTAPTKEGAYDFRMFERSSGKEVATINFTVNKNHRIQDKSVKNNSLTRLDTSGVDGIVDIKPTEDETTAKPSEEMNKPSGTKTTSITKQQNKSNSKSVKKVTDKVLPSETQGIDNNQSSEILFDGKGFGANWEARLETKRRASFEDVAKFENRMLLVDVPKEKSWGQVGLSSKKQLLWLDQFGPGAEKRLTFKIHPTKTTGFAVALATKNESKSFVVKWVRLASKNKTIVQVFVNYGLACNPGWPIHAKPEWEQEVGNQAPSELVLALKPGEITLSGEGLPEHTQKWDSLTADAGFKIHAYSFPEIYDESAQLGLRQISFENTKLSSVEPPAPIEGVEPLPVTEFFGPNTRDGWELTPWATYRKSNKPHNICKLDKTGFVVPHGQTDGGHQKGCDIHSETKVIDLDDRLETANYKITTHFDPQQTRNFRIVLPTAERGNERWVRSLFTKEISLINSTTDKTLMTLDCAGFGQRDVSVDWLQNQWNGKFSLTIGNDWMRCSLDGGPAIRVNETPADNFYIYIVAPDYRNKGTDPKLLLKRLTGQWLLPHPMTAAERWLYLDDEDFNPDEFLKEIWEGE